MRYTDPTERALWCTAKGNFRTLLGCLKCPRYPCAVITDAHVAALQASPFVTLDAAQCKLLPRKKTMYIFKMTTGELREAPATFNPEQPDFAELEEVDEVLVISKVLVKQIRLVAKPKEERAAIRAELSTDEEVQPLADAAADSTPAKRGRAHAKNL